jgi:hypothetical protein
LEHRLEHRPCGSATAPTGAYLAQDEVHETLLSALSMSVNQNSISLAS